MHLSKWLRLIASAPLMQTIRLQRSRKSGRETRTPLRLARDCGANSQRIISFSKINVNERNYLFDLADLVSEIASVKEQPQYSVLFGYFDSFTGINPIVSKLPWNLQKKWVAEASRFKRHQGNNYPPFSTSKFHTGCC